MSFQSQQIYELYSPLLHYGLYLELYYTNLVLFYRINVLIQIHLYYINLDLYIYDVDAFFSSKLCLPLENLQYLIALIFHVHYCNQLLSNHSACSYHSLTLLKTYYKTRQLTQLNVLLRIYLCEYNLQWLMLVNPVSLNV